MKKHLFSLLTLLLLSTLLVTGVGVFIRYQVLEPLGIQRDERLVALPFVLLADEQLSVQIRNRNEQLNTPPTETTQPPATEVTEPPTQPPTQPPTEATTEPPTEPTTEPEPTYLELDASWFDDALFIGESRTTGLRDCARLGDADYFCEGSMTVYSALGWTSSDYDYYEMTLPQLLYQKKYGKVYIHLGLNECIGDQDDVMKVYKQITDLIRETQPDAVIILQSMLTIGRVKALYSDYTLEKVQSLNARIEAFAEEEGFLLSNVNEHFADEEGYLPDNMSSDGVHPYGSYYVEWADWLVESAGWFGIP